MNQLSAEVKILLHKLDRIRSHIERRLSVVEEDVKAEFDYILSMIKEFEVVDSNWELPRPLVERREEREEK